MKKNVTNTQNWFQNWANEYDNTVGKVKRHHKLLDLAVQLSEVKRHEKVLDIGSGTGLLSLKFLAKRDCLITAIDSSSQMLKIFENKIEQCRLSDKISCIVQSAENMNFPKNHFDIAAATVVLHHVKDKYAVIKKIFDSLKPGGRFVLGEIDMDTTGDVQDPNRLLRIIDYLKEEFALAMKEGGVQAFNRMYDNGKKHILNDGEFCISLHQWKSICKKAKFKNVTITPLKEFEWFKVLVATK